MKTNQQLVQSAKKHAYYQVGKLEGGTLIGISFSGPWGRISVIEDGSYWIPKKGSVADADHQDPVQLEKAKTLALRILNGEKDVFPAE
jgi:hypothetical protein